MGKSGVGKTSLIKVICKADSAQVGRGTGPTTDVCSTYTIINKGLTINIVDTPGLYNDEGEYVKMIRSKGGEADIIFFCVDMSNNLCGDDYTALQLMGKHFSPRFVEKTVFVLTKANRVERFGDNVKNFTKDKYFKMVLTEKKDEIAKRLQQANLAIDKNTLQVAIAGSPGPCEKREDAGKECVMPSEATEVINGVRVHVNLGDYDDPELWLASFLLTCITSGATDTARLGLVKIHSNWKKYAKNATLIVGGAGAALCLAVVATKQPDLVARALVGRSSQFVTLGGILFSTGGVMTAFQHFMQ